MNVATRAAMAFETAVDLRDVAGEAVLGTLLAHLDRLPDGERLVITTSAWPGELLRGVELNRPGGFVSGPLAEDPGEFRFEFGRRPTGAHAVSAYVGWDQRRLDDMLDEVDDLVVARDFEGARRHYRDFRAGLRHHLSMEEQVLFPLFERLTGDAAPIRSMHAEHVLVRVCADELGDALAASDPRVFAAALDQLHEVLDAHDRREEREIYPRLDAAISPSDRAALVDYLQTV